MEETTPSIDMIESSADHEIEFKELEEDYSTLGKSSV